MQNFLLLNNMQDIVKLENIKKSFGTVNALNGVSFSIKKGEMFGLVGPDGAGKTTIIRILCGIYRQDSGSANIFGYDTAKEVNKIKGDIGYLSQRFSLYGDLTIDENLEFFAEIHGVEKYESAREELLNFTRLKPFRNRLAEKLSGGMKQKLGLICTLIHKPKILFLDEPTTGVDPVSRRDFWKILSELLKSEISIIITTPYLDEVERCARVALLNKGEIMIVDTPNNLKALLKDTIIEIVPDKVREAYKVLYNKSFVRDIQAFGDRLNIFTSDYNQNILLINSVLNENGIAMINSRVIPPSLENVFINLINNNKKKENNKV
jgi:ABC-2 type transport system ATP-binding protein